MIMAFAELRPISNPQDTTVSIIV